MDFLSLCESQSIDRSIYLTVDKSILNIFNASRIFSGSTWKKNEVTRTTISSSYLIELNHLLWLMVRQSQHHWKSLYSSRKARRDSLFVWMHWNRQSMREICESWWCISLILLTPTSLISFFAKWRWILDWRFTQPIRARRRSTFICSRTDPTESMGKRKR